ncbi:MAG: alpha-ketoglutarate-dependent taurine dioxygenase, partial [Gammaproteobacteria bacterium]
ERSALPPVWHKVIQTHPVTGKTAFYLNTDPLEFRGVDFERGLELMKQALALATEPDRTYRYRWAPGDLIIWDNHAMLHSGTPTLSYESDRRLMLRSFVYTQPTERPLSNYDQLCQIFMPDQHSIQLSDFEH